MLSRELQVRVEAEIAVEKLPTRSSNPQKFISQYGLRHDEGLWAPKNRIVMRLASGPSEATPVFLGDTSLRVGVDSPTRALRGIHIALLTTLMTDFEGMDMSKLQRLGLFAELELSTRSGKDMARVTSAADELAEFCPTDPHDFIQVSRRSNRGPMFRLNPLVVILQKEVDPVREVDPAPTEFGVAVHEQATKAILEQYGGKMTKEMLAELGSFSIEHCSFGGVVQYKGALEAFLQSRILRNDDPNDATVRTYDSVPIDSSLKNGRQMMRQVLQNAASDSPSLRWLYMQQVFMLTSNLQALRPNERGTI